MTSAASFIDRADRKTAADVVYETLHARIGSLKLLPNAKISEVEIAEEFGVSRQPVRDAFARLAQDGFLLVRPQKATQVAAFSRSAVQDARFVRLSVELEIAKVLAASPEALPKTKFERNLTHQKRAVDRMDLDAFHALDNEFHELLCISAGRPGAFDTISKMKAQVDRLCKLSLGHSGELGKLIADHEELFDGISKGKLACVEATVRTHLSRLDDTIDEVLQNHPSYFID